MNKPSEVDARQKPDGDEGFAALYLAVLMVGVLALAALVLDGGAALAARSQAQSVAGQAARAGANQLSLQSLRGTSPGLLGADAARAVAAAQQVLQVNDMQGEVSINGTEVTVSVTAHRPTVMLSALGINQVTGNGQATATALYGTNGSG